MFFSYILPLVCHFSVIFSIVPKRKLSVNDQNLERVNSKFFVNDIITQLKNIEKAVIKK